VIRVLKIFGLLLANCLIAIPAHAVVAPMSEAELMAKSDLVALVRVLSVTCTGVYKDGQSGADLCFFLGKLKLIEVKKGAAEKGDEVQVAWQAYPESALDLWAINYYPGEEVWTHLVKQDNGSYASTSWNAKGEAVKPPANYDLPTAIGETLSAP
jgi:hypothetical protein